MDREEFNGWIRSGPIRITMNSGGIVDIVHREMVTVSSMSPLSWFGAKMVCIGIMSTRL